MNTSMIPVEVAYALPEKQKIIRLDVPESTTVYEAARLSGIVNEFPGLVLEQCDMGIFGKMVKDPKSQKVHSGRSSGDIQIFTDRPQSRES